MQDIRQIDPNFRTEVITQTDIRYYSCLEQPVEINGLYRPQETEKFLRMPEEYIHHEGLIDGVRQLIHHTAGGRIRFATDSPWVVVLVEVSDVIEGTNMSPAGHSGVDVYLCQRGNRDYRYRKTIMPEKMIEDTDRFYQGLFRFSNYDTYNQHEVMIHLPLYNGIEKIYIGIQETAALYAPVAYEISKPVCFYGDSITHGGCASRPGNNYPNHLSRWLNCDFINLGFSGSGAGEPAMADYIGSLELSAIVINLELRACDTELFRKLHYPFYARIRAQQPDTPIILMSRSGFPKIPKYGPDVRNFVESNRIIMETCQRGWAEGDRNLYYIDGEQTFGTADQDACTVDGTHPNDLGFYRMAEGIRPVLSKVLKK